MNQEQAQRLGQYIRGRRRAHKLSARELAAFVGVNASQILRLERGEVAAPQAAVLTRIAKHLHVPMSKLFALAGYPEGRNLPPIEPYLRARYPHLDDTAVLHITAIVTCRESATQKTKNLKECR